MLKNFDPYLEAFYAGVTEAKRRTLQRADQILGVVQESPGNPVNSNDSAQRDEARREAVADARYRMESLLGAADQRIDSGLVLRGIDKQAPFVDTRHRAAVLRGASFARRAVHAAARRRSHGVDSGYFDRFQDTAVFNLFVRARQ